MRKGSGQEKYPPDHILVLMEGFRRRTLIDLGERLDASGITVGGSRVRLLQMIPEDGIRITQLAAIAGMTKQALGEFVDSMEREGLVVSERLESDRRVRQVRRTPKGDEASDLVDDAMAEVEDAWRSHVGPRRYDTMRKVMQEIGVDIFDV